MPSRSSSTEAAKSWRILSESPGRGKERPRRDSSSPSSRYPVVRGAGSPTWAKSSVSSGAHDDGGREVDAGGVAHDAGERADDQPATAGDVEHGIVRPRPAGLHEEPERLLVLDARRRGTGHGLAGELVQDRVAMARCR